jgi:hypothetical protein
MGMLAHSNFRFWISDFELNSEVTIQNPNSKIQNNVVEVNGLEPMASCVQSRRSPSWATPPIKNCGFQIQKSKFGVVGLDGVEPSTSRLSGVRSNRTELQAPGCFGLRPAIRLAASTLDFGFIYFIIHSKIQLQKIQNPNEPIRWC